MTSSIRSAAARRLGLLLASLFVLSSVGCAFGEFRPGDPFDRQLTLDQAQHRYTTLVRFSHFQKARAFVEDDERDAFMRRMKRLQDARFTDFDSETVELDADKQRAVVRVTYTIYTPSMPYEVEVEEIQEWSRNGLTNDWRVSSTFVDLAKIAAN